MQWINVKHVNTIRQLVKNVEHVYYMTSMKKVNKMTKSDDKNKLDQNTLTRIQDIKYMDELDSWDREIVRLKIQDSTLSANKIAKIIGCNPQSINKRLKKAAVIQSIDDLQNTALQLLLSAQTEAACKTRDLMRQSEDDRIQLKAAEMILKGVLSDRVDVSVNTFADWVESLDEEKE